MVGPMGEALPGALRECADLTELAFYRRPGKVVNPYNMPHCAGVADSLWPLFSMSMNISYLNGCSFHHEFLSCLQDGRQHILPLISFFQTQPLVHTHLGNTFKSTTPESFKQFHTLLLPTFGLNEAGKCMQ